MTTLITTNKIEQANEALQKAVQTLHDDQGRRIAIGWMDMWESEMPTKEHGWCGVLTLPRELSLSADEKIIMKPVVEMESLRVEELPVNVTSISDEVIKTAINEELLELKVAFSLKNLTAKEFGIKVRCSEDGTEETSINSNCLSCDQWNTFCV